MNTLECFVRASKFHSDRNLTYGDGLPYSYHLVKAYGWGERYRYLLSDLAWSVVSRAILFHDVLEDCAVSYNDIVKCIGTASADVVYRVTDELGKNRSERSARTYPKIRECDKAIFVKLCDRLANTEYALETRGSMYEKYKKEFANFKAALYNGMFDEMWERLEQMYK